MKGLSAVVLFTPPHRPVQSQSEQSPNSKPGNKSPVQIQTTPQDETQPVDREVLLSHCIHGFPVKSLKNPTRTPYCPGDLMRLVGQRMLKCSHPTYQTAKRHQDPRQKTRKHSHLCRTRPSLWVIVSHRDAGTMSGIATASSHFSRLSGRCCIAPNS
jgi:hypothetical protein